MAFNGFQPTDFDSFRIPGLEERMTAIRERIQPKFRMLADILLDETAKLLDEEMHLHIAQHARRTVNPPNDTWMALCRNKRGYKQHPHFQIGLFDDRVFIWLAMIYEAPDKANFAERLLAQKKAWWKKIPSDFAFSTDHMDKAFTPLAALTPAERTEQLHRVRNVKSADLLLGQVLMSDNPLVSDGPAFTELVRQTLTALAPAYKLTTTRY